MSWHGTGSLTNGIPARFCCAALEIAWVCGEDRAATGASFGMAQRILERGQIETLASRSIPRVRLPDRSSVFAQRAGRLRELAHRSTIGGYLQFLAVLADAQTAALAQFTPPLPSAEQIDRAAEFGMPPLPANAWQRDAQWLVMLRQLAGNIADRSELPPALVAVCQQIMSAPDARLEAQADALLSASDAAIDGALAPLIMAALQVHWIALAAVFANAESVKSLDVPGVCPVCGTLPVASIVCAQTPYQGYRYLHCALCATEWHMVRAQCSSCGADGKHVAYHTLLAAEATDDAAAVKDAAVRAETCDVCHAYRKIVFQEKDIRVDPVVDDLATLALDVLLAQQGFHRASGNPLLWQSAQQD
jgi:FdhE protein